MESSSTLSPSSSSWEPYLSSISASRSLQTPSSSVGLSRAPEGIPDAFTASFLSFSTQSANLHVCYLTPSSPYFALVFISPTILHHIILVLSLYASWKHLRVERTTGTSVMLIVRRDQLLYVLVSISVPRCEDELKDLAGHLPGKLRQRRPRSPASAAGIQVRLFSLCFLAPRSLTRSLRTGSSTSSQHPA